MTEHEITLLIARAHEAESREVAMRERLSANQWVQDRDCMYDALTCIGCGCAKEFEGTEGHDHEGCWIQDALLPTAHNAVLAELEGLREENAKLKASIQSYIEMMRIHQVELIEAKPILVEILAKVTTNEPPFPPLASTLRQVGSGIDRLKSQLQAANSAKEDAERAADRQKRMWMDADRTTEQAIKERDAALARITQLDSQRTEDVKAYADMITVLWQAGRDPQKESAVQFIERMKARIAALEGALRQDAEWFDELALLDWPDGEWTSATFTDRSVEIEEALTPQAASVPPRAEANAIMTKPTHPLHAKYQAGDPDTVSLVNDLLCGRPAQGGKV